MQCLLFKLHGSFYHHVVHFCFVGIFHPQLSRKAAAVSVCSSVLKLRKPLKSLKKFNDIKKQNVLDADVIISQLEHETIFLKDKNKVPIITKIKASGLTLNPNKCELAIDDKLENIFVTLLLNLKLYCWLVVHLFLLYL